MVSRRRRNADKEGMSEIKRRPKHRPKAGEKTQREAIYEVIKDTLGERFREGSNVVELVRGKRGPQHGALSLQYQNEDLEKIWLRVARQIANGSIPSKYEGARPTEIAAYARRIVHYWLTHDPRLNGGQKYQPTPLGRSLSTQLAEDRQLQAMRALSLQPALAEQDLAEVNHYIQVRVSEIVLKHEGAWGQMPDWLKAVIEAESKKAA